MYNNVTMKCAVVFLHGFKRNGVNGFENIISLFSDKKSDIINVTYFENHDSKTLTSKHINEIIDYYVKIFNEKYESIIFIGYSFGAIISSMIIDKLKIDTKLFAIAPPTKVFLKKWIKLFLFFPFKKILLKRKLGKERYNFLKENMKETPMEKHPIKISLLINKVRLKNRKILEKTNGVNYLLSSSDEMIKTISVKKRLKKYQNNIKETSFKHDKILSTEKDIFFDWLFENDFPYSIQR